MSDEPKYRDEEWLREQYVEKRLTTVDMAEKCDVTDSTVGRWLKKYNISIRSQAERNLSDTRLTDSDWLRQQYNREEKSTYEIAQECGCDACTVSRWLHKHNIETRDGGTPLADARLNDPDWLHKQYVEEEHSVAEIAEKCGCTATTARRHMDELGIERRTPFSDERLRNAEWLREQYVGASQTLSDIADECDCSSSSVEYWLDVHNIQRRGFERLAKDGRLTDAEWVREQYIDLQKSTYEIAEECGCSSRSVYTWVVRHDIETRGAGGSPSVDTRLTDADWLRREYVDRQLSMVDIAGECGCSVSSVRRWLMEHDIETRPPSPELTGEDHPNWNGGQFPYGPGWNEAKKRAVRKRDDHTCQDPNCSITRGDHREKYDERLHVHHLQKARDVDDPEERNAKENLITLCRDCHRRWEKIADAGLVPEVAADE